VHSGLLISPHYELKDVAEVVEPGDARPGVGARLCSWAGAAEHADMGQRGLEIHSSNQD